MALYSSDKELLLARILSPHIAESVEHRLDLDSAPCPPPPPLSLQQIVSLSQSSCVSPVQLTDGRRGGEGGRLGAESYDRKKAWASINCSLLSGEEDGDGDGGRWR